MDKFPQVAAGRPANLAPTFDEDLPAMAAQMYALANSLCGGCRTMHAVWPYLRLARMVGAAEAGAANIETMLSAQIASGARRLVIAGACDTGLLATVARAARGRATEITVVDICPTPLELCRRFAVRWSLPLKTRIANLTTLDVTDVDLIYANSVLQLIAPAQWVDTLTRMRRALRPGGHLVCVFNAGGRLAGDVLPEYRSRYADWLLAELDRQGIPLPDTREAFHRLASDYSREREAREGIVGRAELIDDMMKTAGFVVRSREQIGMPLSSSYRNLVSKISKRRFLSLAQAPIS
jgi:SAM-dependent methyltransferase